MKKFIFTLLFGLAVSSMSAQSSFSLKDLLKGVSDSTSSSSSGSSLGDILGIGTVGSLVSNILGNDKISPADIVGTWNYSAPAVSFKSDNLLKKAGGAAAAATVENKLAPYYKTAGFDKMVLTVEPDSTFTMKLARGSLSGELTKSDQDGFMTFHFKALKMNIGTMDAAVSKAGNTVTITFDISKLMKLINTAAKISGNSTISGLNKLLQSYDGMQAGFRLLKGKEAASSTTKKK